MKKLLLILLCLPLITLGQKTFVYDNNFENYLEANGMGDGIALNDSVLTANINTVTSLSVTGQNISYLIGIEDFTALTYLDCYNNQLISLDVSNNTGLEYLYCGSNQLTNLNVSGATSLLSLYCVNNQLITLDVSGATSLIEFDCSDNLLTSLDVRNGNNINMGFMDMWFNPGIGTQNNPYLSCINVDDSTFSANNWPGGWFVMDPQNYFSNNCNFITTYVPDDNFENYLEANGMGDGIALNNSVLTANINTVTTLYVDSLNIADLTGIEDFIALTDLRCFYNQLDTLDVSANTALHFLNCSANQLDTLDVSANTVLTHLYCSDNQLDTLDVSANTILNYLDCSANQLDTLDVSANTALRAVVCSNNQLTTLDISNNTNLIKFFCNNNQLTTLNVNGATALEWLLCYHNQLTSLDLTHNTALTRVYCRNNQLDTLDLSANTILTHLYCSDNQLDTLDVSNNDSLTILYCYNNQLTSLNVSNNTALFSLQCNDNQLTSLDLSNNDSLTILYCNNNQLTSLDVRNGNNTLIYQLYTINNPNLSCIDVDDPVWSAANWFAIDLWTSFSSNCATAFGCTDPLACNYDSLATIDDSSCVYPVIWQQTFLICNGDSVVVGSSAYDTAGTYTDTLNAANGCDSIVYTNISITPPIVWQQAFSICNGDSVVVGSSAYDTAGNYTDTLNAANGCDSIVYTYLVVDQNTSSYDTLSVTSSIVWNGMILTVSGDYSIILVNSAGCDSIANLNLTILPSGVQDLYEGNKRILRIINVLGEPTKPKPNTPLFYIYDDGTVEKKIIIE